MDSSALAAAMIAFLLTPAAELVQEHLKERYRRIIDFLRSKLPEQSNVIDKAERGKELSADDKAGLQLTLSKLFREYPELAGEAGQLLDAQHIEQNGNRNEATNTHKGIIGKNIVQQIHQTGDDNKASNTIG